MKMQLAICLSMLTCGSLALRINVVKPDPLHDIKKVEHDLVNGTDAHQEILGDYLLQDDLEQSGIHSLDFLSGDASAARLALMKEKALAPKKPSNSFFVFTHHKTGTFMGNHILESATKVYGTHFGARARGTHPCLGGKTAIYQNMNTGTLKNLRNQCPDFRAVHIVRNAISLTASGYLYHKWNARDTIPGTNPGKLNAAKTLADKLRVEAKAESRSTLPEMTDLFVESQSDPNVLTVHYEDFHDHFDETVESMFQFLFDADEAKLAELMPLAQTQDVNRWTEEQKKTDKHVASATERLAALKELKQLVDEQDETIMQVDEYNTRLQYKFPEIQG